LGLGRIENPSYRHEVTGLRGYKARHNLAVLYRDQGRPAQAAKHRQLALAERPDFAPAVRSVAELRLALGH
jgi:hypothetical protein